MSDEKKLADIKAEMATLEAARDRYFVLSRQAYELSETIRKRSNSNNLSKLTIKTWFEECEYPSMGQAAKNGYANFKDEETANALIAALRTQSSYYYAYVLHWEGPGHYDVVPDYHRDYDGETVYTANFVKQVGEDE